MAVCNVSTNLMKEDSDMPVKSKNDLGLKDEDKGSKDSVYDWFVFLDAI